MENTIFQPSLVITGISRRRMTMSGIWKEYISPARLSGIRRNPSDQMAGHGSEHRIFNTADPDC